MSRTVKIVVALVEGVLATIGLCTILYILLADSFRQAPQHGIVVQESAQNPQGQAQTPQKANLPDFRYSFPMSIYKSPYLILKVAQTETDGSDQYKRRLSSLADAEFESGITVNLVFFNPTTQDFRLLFDWPAFIQALSCPTGANDSGQTKILYDVLTKDTNHDGVINSKDNTVLFSSELNGTGLSQITSDSVSVVRWQFAERHRSIVIEVKTPPKDPTIEERAWPRRLLWYDLVAKSFKYHQLDTLIIRAKSLVLK